MWKALAIVMGVLGMGLGLAVYASATSTFKLKYMRAPDANIVVDSSTGAARLIKEDETKKLEESTGTPKLVADERVHEFGRMDPETKGQHGFLIRNVGDGALTIKVKRTSCKCTVGGVERNVVGPGETTYVVLEWNTGHTLVDYEQTATIETNDPKNREIDLRVKGLIRKNIGATTEEIDCDVVEPGKPLYIKTFLYSQMWNEFEVIELTSGLPDIQWEVAPVVEEEKPKIDTKGIQQLKLTLSGKLPQGNFQDRLRIVVRPHDPPGEAVTFELPIKGKILRRLAVYGNSINGEEGIDMGSIPEGKGKTVRLLMKVRDEQLDLNVEKVEIEPAFLKAEVKPHMEGETAKPGLYDLVVEVHADAPTCLYRGNPEGKIKIVIKHPRIESLELPVRFSVVP